MSNKYDLDGQVAVVTGGASGIGEAICLKLGENMAKVAVVDINLEGAQSVVERMQKAGQTGLAVQTDVTDEKAVESMVDTVVKEWGAIDILVNNAGILTFDAIVDMSFEEWNRVLNINLNSVFLCTQKVLPHMVKKQRGKIVNVGSSLSSRCNIFNTSGGSSNYCVSKSAVQALTRSIVGEHGKDGINANCIAPGIVDTPMHDDHKDLLQHFIQFIPNNRLSVADDLAGLTAFLASEEANYINGQNIHVNGGMLMVD